MTGFDKDMARCADETDRATEMFEHAMLQWSLGTNGFSGKTKDYPNTVRGFQNFVLDYFDHFAECERACGSSFREHQIKRDSLTDEDKLAIAYYNSRN